MYYIAMSDAILECECGHLMRVSSFAIGSKGKCPQCLTVLTVTEDNIRPAEEVAPPGQPVASAEVLEETQGPGSSRMDWEGKEDASPAALERKKKGTFLGIDPKSKGFKVVLSITALGTVATAIVFSMTEGFDVSSATSATPSEPLDLPDWADNALYVWQYVTVYLAGWLAVYIVLRNTKMLPHDRFFADALVISVAILATTVVHVLLAESVGPYGSLASLAGVVITYFILDWFLSYGVRDFIITFAIYWLFVMLINQATVLVAGSLYNAFT